MSLLDGVRPLDGCPLFAFLPTTDLTRARTFYCETLGLELLEEDPFALVFDVAGTMLRITPVGAVQRAPYTVLGWRVDDITTAVRELNARGVAMTRFAGMEQDGDGVWHAPGGARVAWFADPDGNTLSLTQLPPG